jgi:hypothetical protein
MREPGRVVIPYRADVTARAARFEATIARLEVSQRDFARRRPLYVRSLLALACVGFACFAFGAFVGLWGSISASVVSSAGYGMMRLRASELASEIEALRREVARMRVGGPPTT